jgi:O-antigen/teichoic acid export membrane protein
LTNTSNTTPRLDGSWRRLLSGSGTVLLIKILGAFGGFLFSLLVARKFGDAALGRAELFVLAITVGATLLRGGFEGAVVKLFGGWSSEGAHGRIIRRFLQWTKPLLLMAAAVTVWGFIMPGSKWGITMDSRLGLAIGSWILIGWAGEALRGTGRVAWYALLQPGWWMLMGAVLIVLLGWQPTQVLSITALALAIFGMASAVTLFRRSARLDKAAPLAHEKNQDGAVLRRLALPIWMGSMLHLVLSWADTAMLAAWMDEAAVAHYRAAFRLAALLTFTQFAVNALGAPTFGALHASGDREGLRRTVHRIGWMNTAVALPGLLFLAVLGPWLLGFWGAAFSTPQVYSALLILLAGQCFNALCGPVMYLLNMTDGEKAGLVILAVSAVAQLSAALFLVPAFGIVGGAASAALGMLFWNGLGVWYIRRKHGFIMVSLLNGWWRRS